MKLFFASIGALVLLIVGFSVWSSIRAPGATSPAEQSTGIVSASGLHWHSTLAIIVRGERIEIPPGVGLGVAHQTMHTHDEDAARGVLHMEFPALVREGDLRLARFFSIWGKDMRSMGANMRMTVNGAASTEYENYKMKDGDVIELQYD